MITKIFKQFVKEHTLEGYDKFWTMAALCGELGELANVIKKEQYYIDLPQPDYKDKVDQEVASGKRKPYREQFVDEAGDVMFYLMQQLNKQGVTLEEVMEYQMAKLDRQSVNLGKTYKK
jgi:NTP pyrophosphatase (non-canonical NTP hydrolase)